MFSFVEMFIENKNVYQMHQMAWTEIFSFSSKLQFWITTEMFIFKQMRGIQNNIINLLTLSPNAQIDKNLIS